MSDYKIHASVHQEKLSASRSPLKLNPRIHPQSSQNTQHQIRRDLLRIPVHNCRNARAGGADKSGDLGVGKVLFLHGLDDLGIKIASDVDFHGVRRSKTEHVRKFGGIFCFDGFNPFHKAPQDGKEPLSLLLNVSYLGHNDNEFLG